MNTEISLELKDKTIENISINASHSRVIFDMDLYMKDGSKYKLRLDPDAGIGFLIERVRRSTRCSKD